MSEEDPIHEEKGQWWFWDEVWCDKLGPYSTRVAAQQACEEYARNFLNIGVPKGYEFAYFRCHCIHFPGSPCEGWFAQTSFCAEVFANHYRRIAPGDPGYAFVHNLKTAGEPVCDSYDHNDPGGCSNPNCFKYPWKTPKGFHCSASTEDLQ